MVLFRYRTSGVQFRVEAGENTDSSLVILGHDPKNIDHHSEYVLSFSF